MGVGGGPSIESLDARFKRPSWKQIVSNKMWYSRWLYIIYKLKNCIGSCGKGVGRSAAEAWEGPERLHQLPYQRMWRRRFEIFCFFFLDLCFLELVMAAFLAMKEGWRVEFMELG